MEAFKEGIKLNDWGSIYLGLKKQWLTPNEVAKYCEKGNITCNEERLLIIYLTVDESLFVFLELIKQFILEDNLPPINHNEDSLSEDFSEIPSQYWIFWEIEFLLRIIHSNDSKKKKLHQVAAIHSEFNYPVTWNNFLFFMPSPYNIPIGIDAIYSNLLNFIAERVVDYQSTYNANFKKTLS